MSDEVGEDDSVDVEQVKSALNCYQTKITNRLIRKFFNWMGIGYPGAPTEFALAGLDRGSDPDPIQSNEITGVKKIPSVDKKPMTERNRTRVLSIVR